MFTKRKKLVRQAVHRSLPQRLQGGRSFHGTSRDVQSLG